MLLIRTLRVKYIERKITFVSEFFIMKTSKFCNTSMGKSVPYQSRSVILAVENFSNYIDWDIYLRKKITYMLELRSLYLIRTASYKMFLMTTLHVKYIENRCFQWMRFFYLLTSMFLFPSTSEHVSLVVLRIDTQRYNPIRCRLFFTHNTNCFSTFIVAEFQFQCLKWSRNLHRMMLNQKDGFCKRIFDYIFQYKVTYISRYASSTLLHYLYLYF